MSIHHGRLRSLLVRLACRARYERLLGPYLDNELGSAERESVKRHLEHCVRCRQQLEELQRVDVLARSTGAVRIDEAYAERLCARVRPRLTGERPAARRDGSRRVVWFGLASGAAALIVLMVLRRAGIEPETTGPGLRPQAAAQPVSGLPETESALVAKAAGEPTGSSARRAPDSREPETDELERAGRFGPATATRMATEYAEAVGKESGTNAATETDRVLAPAGSRARAYEEESLVELHQRCVLSGVPADGAAVANGDTQAALIRWPEPAGWAPDSGQVLLEVELSPGGKVRAVFVSRSSGSADVDSIAVRTVRQAAFQPLVVGGVRRESRIPVLFRYQPDSLR
jgi:TonB family protein